MATAAQPVKSVQNAQQWNAQVEIRVKIIDVEIGYEAYSTRTDWQTEIPMSALGALDYTAITKALTGQAMEKLRVALIAEAQQQSGS